MGVKEETLGLLDELGESMNDTRWIVKNNSKFGMLCENGIEIRMTDQ